MCGIVNISRLKNLTELPYTTINSETQNLNTLPLMFYTYSCTEITYSEHSRLTINSSSTSYDNSLFQLTLMVGIGQGNLFE